MSYRENLIKLNGDIVYQVENFLKERGLVSVLDSHEIVNNSLGYVQLLLRGTKDGERARYKIIKKYLEILISNKYDQYLEKLKNEIEEVSKEEFNYLQERKRIRKIHEVTINVIGLYLSPTNKKELLPSTSLEKIIFLLERQYKDNEYEIESITHYTDSYGSYRIQVDHYEKVNEAKTSFITRKQDKLKALRTQVKKREEALMKK